MRSRITAPARLVAVLAIAALGVTACGSSGGTSSSASSGAPAASGGKNTASAPGVTADTVTIGTTQPLTGPAAPGYSEIAPAMTAMFNYINSQGGVNGRQIKLTAKDDGYNPTNTVTATRELVLQDKVFATVGSLGTPTHTKVVDYLNQSKVPDLFVSSGCQCWNVPKTHPETFGWQPDYVTEGEVLGQYIKDNLPNAKIGFFGQNDELGQDGLQGLEKAIDPAKIVSKQTYVTSDLSQPQGVAAQISALKAAGADTVVMFTIPAATAVAKLTMAGLSYNPQLVVTNVGSDPVTLGGLLKSFSKGAADQTALEGLITDTYLPPYGTGKDDAWVTLFTKIQKQYNPSTPIDGNVEYGMSLAYTFAQALKNAGQNPTRESIVKAVEANNLTGPGLTPFRYSADNHAGYSGVQVYQIKSGKPVLSGDTYTSDSAGGALKKVTALTVQPGDNSILKP